MAARGPPAEIIACGDFEFTENGSQSTRVRFALDFTTSGPMKLISAMINRAMRREVAQLYNLKTVLERMP
jgi:hypothetical protein